MTGGGNDKALHGNIIYATLFWRLWGTDTVDFGKGTYWFRMAACDTGRKLVVELNRPPIAPSGSGGGIASTRPSAMRIPAGAVDKL